MGLLDSLGDLVKQATGGAGEADVHATYDRVAESAPQGDLAAALGHAFNSDQTPPFEQMVSGMFSKSNADQKAGVLNQILASLPPGALTQVLGSMGGLGGILSGGRVTPAQAEQVSPADVEVLAQNAARHDSSIVDAVAGFYAQHSALIKTIGAGALSLLVSRMAQGGARSA